MLEALGPLRPSKLISMSLSYSHFKAASSHVEISYAKCRPSQICCQGLQKNRCEVQKQDASPQGSRNSKSYSFARRMTYWSTEHEISLNLASWKHPLFTLLGKISAMKLVFWKYYPGVRQRINLIRLSRSPAGATMLFVSKEDVVSKEDGPGARETSHAAIPYSSVSSYANT